MNQKKFLQSSFVEKGANFLCCFHFYDYQKNPQSFSSFWPNVTVSICGLQGTIPKTTTEVTRLAFISIMGIWIRPLVIFRMTGFNGLTPKAHLAALRRTNIPNIALLIDGLFTQVCVNTPLRLKPCYNAQKAHSQYLRHECSPCQ